MRAKSKGIRAVVLSAVVFAATLPLVAEVKTCG